MKGYPCVYVWGKNLAQAKLKGRRCRIVARGTRNNRLIEFEDGEKHIVSGNSLRKIKEQKQ